MRKSKWFIKVRWSYLPSSWPGVLTYIPYLVYMIGVLVFVLNNKDTFWAAIFTVIPNWIVASLVLQWIASHKS